MQFTWDPRKSEANELHRRIAFTVAVRLFEGFVVEFPDVRRDYGERRIIALGVVDGIGFTVVYTDRRGVYGEVERRIISVRRSNRKERNAYEQSAKETDL